MFLFFYPILPFTFLVEFNYFELMILFLHVCLFISRLACLQQVGLCRHRRPGLPRRSVCCSTDMIRFCCFFFFLVGGNQDAWSLKWGSGLTNNLSKVNALFVL